MNTQTTAKTARNNKFIFLLFFIVLIGPILFAYHLVQKGNAHQLRLTNHGDLISPPVNITTTPLHNLTQKQDLTGKSLHGKWWLVYVGPAKCQQTCHDVIYNLRQIRTSLGKDASRLERLFIAHPNCEMSVCEKYLSESYPDMMRAQIAQQDFENLFHPISSLSDREMVGEIYIMDPKGNIMMHYAADAPSRDIRSDIKRLLKVSKIG